MKAAALIILAVVLIIPWPLLAQTNPELVEQEYLQKARVLEASRSTEESIEGTDLSAQSQVITIEVLDGPEQGVTATFQNDYIQVETGDIIYVRHTTGGFGVDFWSVADPYRLDVLAIVGIVFLVLIFLFGGLQGVRGLASLMGSLVLIFYVLLPGIHSGFSPILVSVGVASLIILVGSYITHGFNRTTSAAVLGMLGTVVLTGIATYFAIVSAELSGFTSEENVYLNFSAGGTIDMLGLLFGAIMIGLLGVLYDIAIGQAVAVDELFDAGRHLSRHEVFLKGMRIGREHIGALINTLAIAYVGASLPLFLLIQHSTAGTLYLINSELFATEILRILMGSIGLILAVPITTLIASYLLYKKRD